MEQNYADKERSKLKKQWVLCLVFGIVATVLIFAVIAATIANEGDSESEDSPIMLILPLFAGLVVCVVFFIKKLIQYKRISLLKDTDVQEKNEQMVKEATRICNAGLCGNKFKNCEVMDTFHTTKDFGMLIKFDTEKMLWCLPSELKHDTLPVYKYSDIEGVQIVEDGREIEKTHAKTKTGRGGAIAGGLMFGAVGAVAGAMTGKKKTNQTTEISPTCTKLQIMIFLNDAANPIKFVDIITKEVKRTDKKYQENWKKAQEIYALLNLCMKQANPEDDGEE